MTVPARVLGLEDEIGRIQAGFAADVIAVEGNPLHNVRVMEDVRLVMRAGRMDGKGPLARDATKRTARITSDMGHDPAKPVQIADPSPAHPTQ